MTRAKLALADFLGNTLSQNDRYLFSELKPGELAIDCGANVGVITQLMAERGADVHAFEPNPFAFEQLEARFGGLSNVTLHRAAVGTINGKMNLYFRVEHNQDPLKYSIGSTLVSSKTDIDPNESIEVDVVSLRDFVLEVGGARLLKLDVEGAEYDILEDLLKTGVIGMIDLVLVETHEDWIPGGSERLAAIEDQLRESRVKNVYLNWI